METNIQPEIYPCSLWRKECKTRTAGHRGDMGEGSIHSSWGELHLLKRGHLGCSRVEALILGLDVRETEKLRVGEWVLARGRVGEGVVKVIVTVSGFVLTASSLSPEVKTKRSRVSLPHLHLSFPAFSPLLLQSEDGSQPNMSSADSLHRHSLISWASPDFCFLHIFFDFSVY